VRQPLVVRCLALAPVWVVFAASPVAAEDFSGFYAGINAGYAFDRTDRESGIANPFVPSVREDHRLPPSAAASTLATRGQRAGAPIPTRSR